MTLLEGHGNWVMNELGKRHVHGEERMARAIGEIEDELRERLQEFEQQGKLLEAQRIKIARELVAPLHAHHRDRLKHIQNRRDGDDAPAGVGGGDERSLLPVVEPRVAAHFAVRAERHADQRDAASRLSPASAGPVSAAAAQS